MFEWINRNRKWFVLSILLVLSSVITSNQLVNLISSERVFDEVHLIEKRKVGLVLGASKTVSNGSQNLYFKYRVEAAVELFKAGKIEYILVSGENSTHDYNEPLDFKNELIRLGVPENRIFLDFAGLRTLDSIVRANKIFGQSKFTVISQKFHNQRAIYLATMNGLDAIGYNAKDVNGKYGLKTNLREYLARSKAVFDVAFGTKPKYLGETIVIE